MTQVSKTIPAYDSAKKRKGDIVVESGKRAKQAAAQMSSETSRAADRGGKLLAQATSGGQPAIVSDNSNSTFNSNS